MLNARSSPTLPPSISHTSPNCCTSVATANLTFSLARKLGPAVASTPTPQPQRRLKVVCYLLTISGPRRYRNTTYSLVSLATTGAYHLYTVDKMSGVLRSVKNVTKGYSSVQVKVRNGKIRNSKTGEVSAY